MIRCFFVEALGDGTARRDGKIINISDLPPGAMWYADWYSRKGPDGHHLIVKTPGGDWHVDGRANNCTRGDDNKHYCWVRHGVPPLITVDKNGDTCGCGASIGQGPGYRDYHGWLRGGELVPC
jgi:hypothetical protein